MSRWRVGALLTTLAASLSLAQGHPGEDLRPSEDDLFGVEAPASATPDAGTSDAGSAENRPSEDALFGEAPPAITGPEAQVQPRGAELTNPELRERSVFEPGETKNQFEENALLDDPLRIGGLFYLRTQLRHSEGISPRDTAISTPTLVDAYMDARPTDRLRAFVSARLTFDPTRSTGTDAAPTPGFGFGGLGASANNPAIFLDEAWLRFDILRTVFVTAGKQHVKWGTSRFFNPTDVLTPQRRDPLLVFDPRLGASMVKFHVPWEAKGWNFYAIALLDNAGAATTLGQVGGAARAEVVVGPAELGIGTLQQPGRAPLYALDLSSALGPIDVYGELALLKGTDRPVYRFPDNPVAAGGFAEEVERDGINPQVSGGLTWTFAYSDTDTLTLGAEYFYNSLGANAVQLYPFLIVNGLFVPFYTGQHYAAAYALLIGPGSWDNSSFVLSTLTNLTDRSALSRLDYSHRLLRDLTVEAFGAVSYGNRGEFKLGGTVPSFTLPDGTVTQTFVIPEPTFQLGLGLRLNI